MQTSKKIKEHFASTKIPDTPQTPKNLECEDFLGPKYIGKSEEVESSKKISLCEKSWKVCKRVRKIVKNSNIEKSPKNHEKFE